ncbi:MAG: acetolactate decarboxylase [Planctomycetaceae bacterium]|nr:acetolactate decarboxylase [Planctomycetaceae bacterium]
MKLQARWIALAAIAAHAAGCSPLQEPPARAPTPRSVAVDDALVQFSLVAALAAGDYVAGPTLGEVLTQGDFGVGTFSRLAGEMIVLEGAIYQAHVDGTIHRVSLDDTTPFAAVKFFTEDGRIEGLAAPSLDVLDRRLDEQLARRNVPYAIRIDGEFAALTLRSVAAQSPPFKPLVDVVKQQVTWSHQNVRGTLVGLRCPPWVGTLNVAGYHWHFLSDDRQIGGHVLACELSRGTLRYDECSSLVLHLPRSREFDEFDAGLIDKGQIDQIERQRVPAAPR